MSNDAAFDPSPAELVPQLTPAAELAILARSLYREGYDDHISGHISYRQDDGTLLVNPYHLRWDELRASHVARIDLDGTVLDGEWRVSRAIELHLELHRTRTDVTVGVHNHPQWGTVWANLGRVPPIHDQTSSMIHAAIAVHDHYGSPVGDRSEAAAAVDSLGAASAVLLAHHGVFVVADSIERAYVRSMSLEWRCRHAWRVEAVGGAAPMPPEAARSLVEGIDANGYPGLWEAMARKEIQLDPSVLR